MTKLQKERNAFEYATNVVKVARKMNIPHIEFAHFGNDKKIGVVLGDYCRFSLNELNEIVDGSKLDERDMICTLVGGDVLSDSRMSIAKIWYYWGVLDD